MIVDFVGGSTASFVGGTTASSAWETAVDCVRGTEMEPAKELVIGPCWTTAKDEGP